MRKIQDETALLPSYKEDKQPYFESSRDFFYTTLLNVNYGMTDVDFDSLVEARQVSDGNKTPEIHPENSPRKRKIHPESEEFTQKIHPETEKTTQKKIGKTAQAIIDAIVSDGKTTRKELFLKKDRIKTSP